MERILRGQEKDDQFTKAMALRMLVHFIGDLHQPLHVGNEFDRGGNFCVVQWMNRPSNLHRVWDENIINSTELSYTEIADHIDHPTRKQLRELQSTTYMDWLNESKKLRPTVYPNLDGEGIQSPEDRKYCKKKYEDQIDQNLIPKLGWNYRFKHLKTLETRLIQAGVRLAGVLNSIYR